MSSAKFMLTYARVIIFRRYEAHAPGAPLLKAFESMMVKHGVDLTLTGHEHAYERVHPNINGTVVSTLSSNGEYIAPKARTTKPLPHRHLVNLRTLMRCHDIPRFHGHSISLLIPTPIPTPPPSLSRWYIELPPCLFMLM